MAEQVSVLINAPPIATTDAGDFQIFGGNFSMTTTGAATWSSSVFTKAQMYAGQTVTLPGGKDDTTSTLILWSHGTYAGCAPTGSLVKIPTLKIVNNSVFGRITEVKVSSNVMPHIPPSGGGTGDVYYNHPSKSLDGTSVSIAVKVKNMDNFAPHNIMSICTGSDGVTAFQSGSGLSFQSASELYHLSCTVPMYTSDTLGQSSFSATIYVKTEDW